MKKLLSAIAILTATTGAWAQNFDNLPDPVEDVNKVVDNTPDSIAKALMSRPEPGSTRKGNNPVLFLVGNSTMRNGTKGDGSNGQWGWGFYASKYFNANKISVETSKSGDSRSWQRLTECYYQGNRRKGNCIHLWWIPKKIYC